MQQNTNFYARIVSISFIIFFVSGIIMYFFPSEGNVKWLKYNTALELASKQGKPVLLYLSNRFSKVNKLANKSIFSNDTILSFIESKLVPGKLNLDEKLDAEMAKNRYQLEDGKYSILLDKYGRGIVFLDNTWSAGIFVEFARKALAYPYFDFLYYDDAKLNSSKSNKPILMIITNDYYQNINMNEKLSDEKTLKYFNDGFVPIAMMSYEEWDRSILKNYLASDDPIINSRIVESDFGIAKFKTSPPPIILIISPDNKVIAKIVLEDTSVDLISEVEKAFKNEEKIIQTQ